jgi:carbon starvation protein
METLRGRTGGGVTLAVGMAKVFTAIPGLAGLMSYWYHFVIMFEALFILTLLETGTRVTRFVFQETLGQLGGGRADGSAKWGVNIALSVVTCFAWGYLLYTGNINTLWSMLGIANQLLAAIALAVGTTYLLRHAPKRRYALLAAVPFVWVLVTTYAAGGLKIQEWVGKFATAPADQVFSLHLMTGLAGLLLALTAVISAAAVRSWWEILAGPPRHKRRTARLALPARN